MENYLDKCADMKVEIEELGLEDSEVCLRYILTHERRRGSRIFEVFSTKDWLGALRTEGCAARDVAKSALPERRMRTPLPQQSSSSTMEEGSSWSAQERTAMARMQQWVNNSECVQLDNDGVEECSLGLEYADVDVKQILNKATREVRNIF